MKPQILKDARKHLNDVRQEMVRAIVSELSTANDQQLTRVALVFWPEPEPSVGSTSKAKTKGKKSATNSVTDASRKNAAEGRRAVATGERPSLKDAMVLVMGPKAMDAQGVVDALTKKKWLPASSDHRQYISFMLSSNCPETFERTETRGFYRVAKGAFKKVQARERARKAELEAQQSLRELWGIPPSPVTNGKSVTAATVWEAVKERSLSEITLPKLAKHMGCAVNQLGSPLTKLRREGKLVRQRGKGSAVFQVKSW